MTDCDVVIVGAGPTGLSLAAQCLRYGLSFVIIDRKDAPTELSKALVVHARTIEIYDQYRLAASAREQDQPLTKVVFLSEGKVAANPDFSQLGAKFTPFRTSWCWSKAKTSTCSTTICAPTAPRCSGAPSSSTSTRTTTASPPG